MRVVILTEGGGNSGLGHISRCLSLYLEISKRKIQCEFIINGDVNYVDFLKGVKYKNENWLSTKFVHDELSSNDYVIIDSYKASKSICKSIVSRSRNVVFIDDIGRLDYPRGIIVNPSLDANNIDYSKSLYTTLLSGPDYVIVRPSFFGLRRENTKIGVRRVLIIMGGTDIRGLSGILINSICNNHLDFEFYFVLGGREVDKFVNCLECKNISIYSNINADQMVGLMMNCDLAITAAGQTIYELLATQTPFIPIRIIDNQDNNINSLLKYNPNQIILDYNDKNLDKRIFEILNSVKDSDEVKKMNSAYNNLIDGCGAKRVVDALLKGS